MSRVPSDPFHASSSSSSSSSKGSAVTMMPSATTMTSRLFNRRSDSSAAAAVREEREALLQREDDDGQDAVVFAHTPAAAAGATSQVRRKESPPPFRPQQVEPHVEVDVPAGATLASLALKYNVALSELKRINNLISENELHAHATLKIPAKPDSIRSQMLLVDLSTSPPVEAAPPPLLHRQSIISSSSPVMSESSETGATAGELSPSMRPPPPPDGSRQAKKAKRFLRAMDRDLEGIRKKNETLMRQQNRNGDQDLVLRGAFAAASPATSTCSKLACTVGVMLVVAVVLLILWFARHEFLIIKDELPSKEENHSEAAAATIVEQ